MLKLLRIHSSFTTTVDAQLHFWGLNRDIAVRTWLGRQYTNFARYSFTHFFFFFIIFHQIHLRRSLTSRKIAQQRTYSYTHLCIFFLFTSYRYPSSRIFISGLRMARGKSRRSFSVTFRYIYAYISYIHCIIYYIVSCIHIYISIIYLTRLNSWTSQRQ